MQGPIRNGHKTDFESKSQDREASKIGHITGDFWSGFGTGSCHHNNELFPTVKPRRRIKWTRLKYEFIIHCLTFFMKFYIHSGVFVSLISLISIIFIYFLMEKIIHE